MAAPILLLALVGGAAFALSKLKPGNGAGNGMPGTTPGTLPIISGGGVANTIQSPSGGLYNVTTYPTNSRGNKPITAQLVGMQTVQGTTQVNEPLAWLSWEQNIPTGLLSNLSRGERSTAAMLADFGLNNVK